jgi:hypothetical protein
MWKKYSSAGIREGHLRYFTFRKDAVIICDDISAVSSDRPGNALWRGGDRAIVNECHKRADTVYADFLWYTAEVEMRNIFFRTALRSK